MNYIILAKDDSESFWIIQYENGEIYKREFTNDGYVETKMEWEKF